jgi:hypothetical protein
MAVHTAGGTTAVARMGDTVLSQAPRNLHSAVMTLNRSTGVATANGVSNGV